MYEIITAKANARSKATIHTFNVDIKLNMKTDTLNRKRKLEDRLKKHGIKEYHVEYLPNMDFDDSKFATSYEAGCRMMILYAVAYTAQELDNKQAVTDWLKQENLWIHVSPNERDLFGGKVEDEQKLIDFLWQGECAYILAWALNIIKKNHLRLTKLHSNSLRIL